MGITGLLPFLKNASQPINIRDFKGCTVAVDTYCWLHRGAFGCAEKLAMGEKTDAYISYVVKRVNILLSYGIKPIMVFDGCRLPSKELTEKDRRERRKANKKLAAQYLREGNKAEARACFQRSIDITSQMAHLTIEALHDIGVDCIVAPYEADAQLAYLNKIGLADFIVTEDSDLMLFGCDKVIFKLDTSGNGILIEQSKLADVTKLRNYTFERFRFICILSGCDYLASLPGIGLVKATKLFKLTQQTDPNKFLKRIPTFLRMSNLKVREEYIEGFIRANNTFLYQLVIDPRTREIVPLNPYPSDIDPGDLHYAGPPIPPQRAIQLGYGNIDVTTGHKLGSFDPDNFKPKQQKKRSWNDQSKPEYPTWSIWKKGGVNPPKWVKGKTISQPVPSTKGKVTTVNFKRPQMKRKIDEIDEEIEKTDAEFLGMYSQSQRAEESEGNTSVPDNDDDEDEEEEDELPPVKAKAKGVLYSMEDVLLGLDKDESSDEEEELEQIKVEPKSPVTPPRKKRNIFAVDSTSKSLKKNEDNKPITVQKSRYFANSDASNRNGRPSAEHETSLIDSKLVSVLGCSDDKVDLVEVKSEQFPKSNIKPELPPKSEQFTKTKLKHKKINPKKFSKSPIKKQLSVFAFSKSRSQKSVIDSSPGSYSGFKPVMASQESREKSQDYDDKSDNENESEVDDKNENKSVNVSPDSSQCVFKFHKSPEGTHKSLTDWCKEGKVLTETSDSKNNMQYPYYREKKKAPTIKTIFGKLSQSEVLAVDSDEDTENNCSKAVHSDEDTDNCSKSILSILDNMKSKKDNKDNWEIDEVTDLLDSSDQINESADNSKVEADSIDLTEISEDEISEPVRKDEPKFYNSNLPKLPQVDGIDMNENVKCKSGSETVTKYFSKSINENKTVLNKKQSKVSTCRGVGLSKRKNSGKNTPVAKEGQSSVFNKFLYKKDVQKVQ